MELLRQVFVPNGGPQSEADLFLAMFPIPYVTRSSEFANVDGALDCTIDPSSAITSFADRFYTLAQRLNADPTNPSHVLVPFDVKSSISYKSEVQKYHTSVNQRRHVAFYIAVCSADPRFVEVIPNALAGESLGSGTRSVAVNRSCEALTHPRTYHFLSPCNSLYRMLLELLSVALHRTRACALDESLRYMNPWTGACFSGWKPYVLYSIERLAPDEDTQQSHFTAYEGTARIQWAIRNAYFVQGVNIRFNFVLHQPRLADFKLITPLGEWLVQYKIHSYSESQQLDLSIVTIARTRRVRGKNGQPDKDQIRYYFTAFNQFDYLLDEFQCPASGEDAKPGQ